MKKVLKHFFATLVVLTAIMAGAICVQAATPVTVPSVYTGAIVNPVVVPVSYTESDFIKDYYAGVVIPVVVKEPGYLEVSVDIGYFQNEVDIAIYNNPECTGYVGYIKSYNANDTENVTEVIEIETAGTYYLRAYTFVSYSDTSKFTNSCNISMSLYNLADKTIKNNQTYYYYNESSSKAFNFKYTATKNGTVTISYTENAYGKVALLDSNMKLLSEDTTSSTNNNVIVFAVKKGQTYYINSNAYDFDSKIGINIKEKKIKEKSGKSKKKAVNIKAKKKISGTILAGEKKADWYKLSNKKLKKLKLTVTTMGVDDIKITVYNSKGSELGSRTIYSGYKNSYNIINGTVYGKASKGTYYIKVERAATTSSGSYTLKWK